MYIMYIIYTIHIIYSTSILYQSENLSLLLKLCDQRDCAEGLLPKSISIKLVSEDAFGFDHLSTALSGVALNNYRGD